MMQPRLSQPKGVQPLSAKRILCSQRARAFLKHRFWPAAVVYFAGPEIAVPGGFWPTGRAFSGGVIVAHWSSSLDREQAENIKPARLGNRY
jgi:hypothetical protein